MIRILLLGIWLLVSSVGAAATTIIEESFIDYAGLGLSPGGSGGTLDSLQWRVFGASSGDRSSKAPPTPVLRLVAPGPNVP